MKGPIEDHLEPPLSDGQLQSIARKVQASRHAERARPSRLQLALAMAVGVPLLVAAALWFSWPRAQEPIATASGAPLPSTLTGAFAFSDGSQLSLEQGTSAEVVANQAGKLTLLLREGRGRFEVNPKSHRQWVVETGIASVEVLGTIFTVERGAEGVRVAVERGVVLVRSEGLPDRLQRVEAGHEVFAPATVAASHPSPPAPTSLDAPPVAERPVVEEPLAKPAPPPSRPPSPPPPAPPPDWQTPARRGEFDGAWALLAPAFTERVTTADKAELLLMADTARAVGHPAEAASALTRALERDPSDATVAFTLARLELDQLDRPKAAAAHFERVASASPPSPLRYDALVRQAEALDAAGEAAAASSVAKATLAAFPDGAHTQKLEQLLRTLERTQP